MKMQGCRRLQHMKSRTYYNFWCSIPLVTIQIFVQNVKEMRSLLRYPVLVSNNWRLMPVFAETEQVSFVLVLFSSESRDHLFLEKSSARGKIDMMLSTLSPSFPTLKFCIFSSFSGVTLCFCCSLWDSWKGSVQCWIVTSLLTPSGAV